MIFDLLLAFSGGVLLTASVISRIKTVPGKRYRCPWPACGYPLPSIPLESQRRGHRIRHPETCEGCDRLVLLDFSDRYVRWFKEDVDTGK